MTTTAIQSSTGTAAEMMRAADEARPAQDSGQTDSGAQKVANQETFLKLLVAQIRNQDPLNPADSIEFLTQLAQFSQLEQMLGIREEIKGLREDLGEGKTDPAKTAEESQKA